MSGESVLIMGGTVKAVMSYARRHAVELGITAVEQIIAVTDARHTRGRRGQRLIVLQDCYTALPRWYDLIAEARMSGMEIEYRDCKDEVRP